MSAKTGASVAAVASWRRAASSSTFSAITADRAIERRGHEEQHPGGGRHGDTSRDNSTRGEHEPDPEQHRPGAPGAVGHPFEVGGDEPLGPGQGEDTGGGRALAGPRHLPGGDRSGDRGDAAQAQRHEHGGGAVVDQQRAVQEGGAGEGRGAHHQEDATRPHAAGEQLGPKRRDGDGAGSRR